MSVNEIFTTKFRYKDALLQWHSQRVNRGLEPNLHDRVGALLERPYSEVSESECIELLKEVRGGKSVPVGDDKTITIWYHGKWSYSIDGDTPINVTRTQNNVLQAFLKDGVALDTKDLEDARLTSNASKTMKELAKKFPGAIRLPSKGHKGEGYFARVCDAKTN